jgi:transaldolase/glucose-6-phosphate isomerase
VTQTLNLGTASALFSSAERDFAASRGTARLWARDASLWTGTDEADWLGWLDLTDPSPEDVAPLQAIARDAAQEGIRQVVVMGMGGSSLCPDVLAQTFEPAEGHPRVSVLDSTVPEQLTALERTIDWARTWFVVPSKSGGTIEPNSFLAYFYERAREQLGGPPGRHFIAITDPGSSLEARARELGFRSIVPGIPSVGGRFSALTAFGLLPAALQGIDLQDWLARAHPMATDCGPEVPVADNPGAQLGLAIGALAAAGRDKLSVVLSPPLAALGAWLEQLIAESTGKAGLGVVPIDGGFLPESDAAAADSLFVYVRLATAPAPSQDAAIEALLALGAPVVRIEVADPRDLAAEFFRWEFATAVAGAVLGINPFDQPDVESAKQEARSLMDEFEASGGLPETAALLEEDGIEVTADPNLEHVHELEAAIAAHFRRVGRGDYVAINAYLAMSPENQRALSRLRDLLTQRLGVPTSVGFGPRFLHSTGQLHKGGANNGVFLQLTADDPRDLPVPGQAYSFGVLKQAQALGDFAVLSQRGRRALQLHLPAASPAELEALILRVERAIPSRAAERDAPTPTAKETPNHE